MQYGSQQRHTVQFTLGADDAFADFLHENAEPPDGACPLAREGRGRAIFRKHARTFAAATGLPGSHAFRIDAFSGENAPTRGFTGAPRHMKCETLSSSDLRKHAVACIQAAFLLVPGLCAAANATAPVATADARLTRSLMRLDPAQRFQQICDVAAMKVIARESGAIRPDRAMLDALSPAKEKDDTLSGSGGAVRSKGHWRQMSFSCEATPDRLSVLRFTYQLGDEIPGSQWERYGLWR